MAQQQVWSVSITKTTDDDFGDLPSRKDTVKMTGSEKEEKQKVTAIKAELIARGRRIFSPFGYPPINRPPVASNIAVQNSIVLTNVIIKDQKGRFAEMVVIADNTTDISMISYDTIEKFNLAPNVKYSTDQS